MFLQEELKKIEQRAYIGKPLIQKLQSMPILTKTDKHYFIKEVLKYYNSLGMKPLKDRTKKITDMNTFVKNGLAKAVSYCTTKTIVAAILKDIIEAMSYEFIKTTPGQIDTHFVGISGNVYEKIDMKKIKVNELTDILRGYKTDDQKLAEAINHVLEMDNLYLQRGQMQSILNYILGNNEEPNIYKTLFTKEK